LLSELDPSHVNASLTELLFSQHPLDQFVPPLNSL